MANKKRPRHHSFGDGRTRKRSVAGSQEGVEDNSETLNDIIDNVTGGVDGGITSEALRHRVLVLESISKQQETRISDLQAKVDFLLSLLGISEGPKNSELSSSVTFPYSNAVRGVQTDSRGSVDSEPTSGGISAELAAVSRFRTTVAAAVHAENRTIQNRSRNLVFSGLYEMGGVGDKEIVTGLLRDELGLRPVIGGCKRLGVPTDHRTRKLLVTFGTADQAAQVLASAKHLRLSHNEDIRNAVYINADQTRAEAMAAYEQRCRRRAAASAHKARRAPNAVVSDMDVLPAPSAAAAEINRRPTPAPSSSSVPLCPTTIASSPGSAPPSDAQSVDQVNIDLIVARLQDAARGRLSTGAELGLDTSAPGEKSGGNAGSSR